MKPTRATLVSDPHPIALGRLRAFARVAGEALPVSVYFLDRKTDRLKGDTVNARYEAGEWRVG
jgi:hypothetical protein